MPNAPRLLSGGALNNMPTQEKTISKGPKMSLDGMSLSMAAAAMFGGSSAPIGSRLPPEPKPKNLKRDAQKAQRKARKASRK